MTDTDLDSVYSKVLVTQRVLGVPSPAPASVPQPAPAPSLPSAPQTELAPAPSSPLPESNSVIGGGGGTPSLPSYPEPLPTVKTPESPVRTSGAESLPTPAEEHYSGDNTVGGGAPVAPASSSSYSATSTVTKEETSESNNVPASSNSIGNEEAPYSPSQILPAAPNPTAAPAVVTTTTQQAFVQEQGGGSAESSYRDSNEDRSEPDAPLVPVPAPAKTYTEVKPSSQPESVIETSVHPVEQQISIKMMPVEHHEEKEDIAPATAPEQELRPEAIIHSSHNHATCI
ncbi:hypothetical protein COOONC_02968 [Cooperia oncophora]